MEKVEELDFEEEVVFGLLENQGRILGTSTFTSSPCKCEPQAVSRTA